MIMYFEIIIKVLVKNFNLFQYTKTYPTNKQNVETISPSIFSRDVFFARRTICDDIQYRRPSPFYRCILVERTSTISYSLDTRYSQYPCIIHCHLDAYIFCRRRTSLEVSQNSLRKPDLVVKTIHSILCRYRFREQNVLYLRFLKKIFEVNLKMNDRTVLVCRIKVNFSKEVKYAI